MIGTPEDHLRLLSFLRELPDDALVSIMAAGVDRHTFDSLPGEDMSVPLLRAWAKRLEVGPIAVDVFTTEPPADEIVAFPVRSAADLRVVKGGR